MAELDEAVRAKLETVAGLAMKRDNARGFLSDVEADLDAACIAAHDAGASWAHIAAVIGVTRQALQKRLADGER